jgi:lipoprotein-anchoring transpeptidase ErfK/SrfK
MLLRRSLPLAAAIAVLAAPSALAQEPAPAPDERRIAAGVFAGGVDLSGTTIDEAAARLAPLDSILQQPILVSVAGKHFTLRPKRARLLFDALRTAKRAYYAGANAPPPPGGRLDVALAVEFRRAVVRDFVLAANKALYLPPRNARVKIGLRRIHKVGGKSGRDLEHRKLRRTLEATLADPAAPRRLTPGRRVIEPKVAEKDLTRRYRTIITIDKSNFRLRLFKRLKLKKSYGIAVGLPAYPTPSGLFSINDKAVNPTWTAPNSPWAGELAGQQVSGGAWNNPLKARWMGIVSGVGIHGTGQEWSIGTRASHGCIRMRVADVIDLYPRVPVGTPVLIR